VLPRDTIGPAAEFGGGPQPAQLGKTLVQAQSGPRGRR
jgi:hypothetical protein